MVFYHLTFVAHGQEIDLKYDTFKRTIATPKLKAAIAVISENSLKSGDVTINLYSSKSEDGERVFETTKSIDNDWKAVGLPQLDKIKKACHAHENIADVLGKIGIDVVFKD